jgi:hypothetical protein
MVRSITKDKQDTLKSLLSRNIPYSRIQKQLADTSLATLLVDIKINFFLLRSLLALEGHVQ